MSRSPQPSAMALSKTSLAAANTEADKPVAAAWSSICSRIGWSVRTGPGAGDQVRSAIRGPRCFQIAELAMEVSSVCWTRLEVQAAAPGQRHRLGGGHRVHRQQQVGDVLHPGAGAERAGVDPRSGDGVEDCAYLVDAALVPGGERGGQPRRDHARAAADRAVEQVTAVGPDQVAEAGLAVHVDGAHLDVDGARPEGGEGAVRAGDDLVDVVGGGDDRDDDVRGRGDLGRAGGHVAALGDELG